MTSWDATSVTGTKAHSICTYDNIPCQQFNHGIGEHVSLEELQVTWAKLTHTVWSLSSNELVTSDDLKTHLLLASHLPSRALEQPQGTGRDQGSGRIIPPSLQFLGQLLPSREVLPHILKSLKMDFLPLMKVNCCVVVPCVGCLGQVCLSGLSLGDG